MYELLRCYKISQSLVEGKMDLEGSTEAGLRQGVGEKRNLKAPSRRRRARSCGNCQGCLKDDCGQCRNCKDKVKFGGPGTKKQRCSMRTCLMMVSIHRSV